MNNKFLAAIVMLALIGISSTAFTQEQTPWGPRNSRPVQKWWYQCNKQGENACLTDEELSKFKFICADKTHREDCRAVVNYAVAKTRTSEGKTLLIKGFKTVLANYSNTKKFFDENQTIWDVEFENREGSFAVGILPSCKIPGDPGLIFGKNPRPEVQNLQNEFAKIYKSLEAIPCPNSENGFVLVAIGKVDDATGEFEVLSINENRVITTHRTTLMAGPFEQNRNRFVTRVDAPQSN